AYRAKVKTPFEFVVSAMRATNADVSNPQALNQTLQRLGMPLYGMQPPTGYSMKADAWVNSAALVNRMNFALALGAGRLNGIQWSPENALRGASLPGDAAGGGGLVVGMFLGVDVFATTPSKALEKEPEPQ